MSKPRLSRIGLFASALAGTFVLVTVAGISADAQDYNWNHNANWNRNRANWNGNWNSGRYGYGYAGYGARRAAAWGAAGTAAAIGSTVYSSPAGCASYNGYYNCGSSRYQPGSDYGYVEPPPYGIADPD